MSQERRTVHDQQVAVLDTESGEVQERSLIHANGEAERLYRDLTRGVLVGMEAVGNSQWFMELAERFGHLDGQIILTSPIPGIMMRLMRTTLTIDPDVERLLQHEIRRTAKSMKAVVNDALRLGLGMQGKPPRGSRYKVNPHPFAFKPGVDVDRLNQLVDKLEAEELARQRTR